ncbi:hypothetical protein D3C84_793020 [compost metagenome]
MSRVNLDYRFNRVNRIGVSGRTQVPGLGVAAILAGAVQTVFVRTGLDPAEQAERIGCGGRTVDCLDHQDAITLGHGTGSPRIFDQQVTVAVGLSSVHYQFVGG